MQKSHVATPLFPALERAQREDLMARLALDADFMWGLMRQENVRCKLSEDGEVLRPPITQGMIWLQNRHQCGPLPGGRYSVDFARKMELELKVALSCVCVSMWVCIICLSFCVCVFVCLYVSCIRCLTQLPHSSRCRRRCHSML